MCLRLCCNSSTPHAQEAPRRLLCLCYPSKRPRMASVFWATCHVFFAAGAPVSRAAPVVLEAGKSTLPSGWKVISRSPRDTLIELTLAVKQTNVDRLEQALMVVSQPLSPRYGQYLSNKAVHDMVMPLPEHSRAILAHFRAAVNATPNGDLMVVMMTVADAETILGGARYELLEHTNGRRIHRCTRSGYSLPSDIAAAIDFISPTVHLPPMRSADDGVISNSARANGQSGPTPITPEILHTLYSVPDNVTSHASSNKMAVTAFDGMLFSEESLQSFRQMYCSTVDCGNSVPKLVGTATTGRPGVESMLDIEYITAMGSNVPSEFWGFAGHSSAGKTVEPFM